LEDAIIIHVILPAYKPNQSWLDVQLRSILSQSSVSLRVWLCSDGSPEEVVPLATGLGDHRITTLFFDQRVGVLANIQRGAESALAASAPGDLFAFADQDDVWHPDKLVKGVAAMPAGPIAVSTHDATVIDDRGRLVTPSLQAYERRHGYVDQLALLVVNSVSGMTMLATREAVARALPFPESVPDLLHDWWIALVVAGAGKIARIDEALVDYRRHLGNVIGAKSGAALSLVTSPPRRPFLGRSYRRMAKAEFEARRSLARELMARNALTKPAADVFLHRRLGPLMRPWHRGGRYAVRCAIGMLLSANPG
jgi:glycosyltransferase involved in cell wall biosynthesis